MNINNQNPADWIQIVADTISYFKEEGIRPIRATANRLLRRLDDANAPSNYADRRWLEDVIEYWDKLSD